MAKYTPPRPIALPQRPMHISKASPQISPAHKAPQSPQKPGVASKGITAHVVPKSAQHQATVPKGKSSLQVPVKPKAIAISGHSPSIQIPATGVRKTPIISPMQRSYIQSTTTMSTKPKGVIAKVKSGVVGALKGGLASIPGIGGAISGAFQGVTADGIPVFRKRRHKGLTYNEIKGAMKLLRLVKRFAPAGHHTAMRIKKR